MGHTDNKDAGKDEARYWGYVHVRMLLLWLLLLLHMHKVLY